MKSLNIIRKDTFIWMVECFAYTTIIVNTKHIGIEAFI